MKCAHVTCHQCDDDEAVMLRDILRDVRAQLAEAKAEVDRLRMDPSAISRRKAWDELLAERDAARAEAERLGLQVRQAGDELAKAHRRREEAAKEVERLTRERDEAKAEAAKAQRRLRHDDYCASIIGDERCDCPGRNS